MSTVSPFSTFSFLCAAAFLGSLPVSHGALPEVEAIISVADQRMVVLKDGGQIARYPISTSKFGLGDAHRSYKTPLGKLRVCDKIGDGLPCGAVLKGRQATSEVLAVNAPGRDPIVTRILWLDGCEGQNSNARGRAIYIHGTPEEKNIGKPMSWGCIRMKSQDVVTLYDTLPVGAQVTVMAEKLPRFPKYVPPPDILIAAKEAPAKKETSATMGKRLEVLPPIASHEPMSSPEAAPAFRKQQHTASAPVLHKSEPITAAFRSAPQFMATADSPSPAGAGGDLTHTLRSSILTSGLPDGNSEIPQLRR